MLIAFTRSATTEMMP